MVSALARSQAIGLPVARLNASPFRAADSTALRKPPYNLAPTFQRTLYVVTSAPL